MYCLSSPHPIFVQGVVPEDLRIRRIRLPANCVLAVVNAPKLPCAEFSLTSDKLDLGNTVGVTEDDTDLRRGGALTGELGDLLNDLLGGGLQPGGSVARVRESGGRNALSVAVKSAHLVGLAAVVMLGMRSEWS